MNLLFKIFIYLLATFISYTNGRAQTPGFSQVKDIENFKKSLRDKHLSTKTIKSNFVQEKHLSYMKEKSVSKGTMIIKEGKKIRIDYTSPFSYLIVINGDKLFIKDGKKVTKINIGADKTFSNLNDILLRSMKGDFDGSKDFSISYLESKEEYLLELVPLNVKKGNFSKISIYLNRSSLQVSDLNMQEVSGDLTKMKFANTEINTNIGDEVFVVR